MRFSWLRRKHLFARLPMVAAVLAGSAVLAVQTAPTASAAARSDIEALVARGTFEPGTFGTDGSPGLVVGDPVFAAPRQVIPVKTLSSCRAACPAGLAPTSPTQGNAEFDRHLQ